MYIYTYTYKQSIWETTHCNTLQHTATHCNTQQHTATHCNTLQARGCVGGAEYIDIRTYVYTYIDTYYPGDRRVAVSEAWMAYVQV